MSFDPDYGNPLDTITERFVPWKGGWEDPATAMREAISEIRYAEQEMQDIEVEMQSTTSPVERDELSRELAKASERYRLACIARDTLQDEIDELEWEGPDPMDRDW
jgi:predicted  nucleic acid-binding Zn-ribbon protein